MVLEHRHLEVDADQLWRPKSRVLPTVFLSLVNMSPYFHLETRVCMCVNSRHTNVEEMQNLGDWCFPGH